jgi:O-antigen/teichoic acid export membrane protein
MRFLPAFIRRRIEHRPNLLKIIDNIGWLFFDQVLRMGVGLLVGVWVARYLGPQQFGLFSFATAFIGLFGAVAGLGLQSIVVRDIVRDRTCKGEILGTAFVLQFIGGLLAYVLILGAIFLMRPDDTLAKWLVAILGSIMLFKFSEVASYWFESQVLSKYTVWVQNSSFLLFSIVKIALIYYHAPLLAFAWATFAEALVVALLMILIFDRTGEKVRLLSFSLMRAKKIFLDSWPALLTGMVLMIQARIDQIMLGQIIGDLEVAKYSVALRIVETGGVSAMILYSTFAPSIINAKSQSVQVYRNKLAAFYKLNMLIGLLIAIPISIFSHPIINLLFGAEYIASAPVLSLMSARLILGHLGVARSIYLMNENLLKYSAFTMIIGATLNVFLNYLIIPAYGALGAAATSLVSFVVTIFIIDIFYVKTRDNSFLILKSAVLCGSVLRRRSWLL